MNNFFPKIIHNVLNNYRGGYSLSAFVKDCISHSDEFRIEGEWGSEYYYIRQAHIEKMSPKDKELYSGYISPSHFLNETNVRSFATALAEEYPEILKDWNLHPNTPIIGSLLDLTHIEQLVFNMALMIPDMSYYIKSTFKNLSGDESFKNPVAIYAYLFGIPMEEAETLSKGFLFNSGFLVESEIKGLHVINTEMARIFTAQQFTMEDIERKLFPSSLGTELEISEYPHLTKEISICESIVQRSLETRAKGTNALFWGLPGTGKTELMLVMAKKNGWDLKIIGDISMADDSEKSRTQRLTSLKVAMKLYASSPNTVLLFDEMEDLFKSSKNETFSKAFINRIIENTPIPIIWTTNELECMGSAVLRRMVYNIGFKVPPATARRVIWDKYINKYNIGLDKSIVDELAVNYDIVPALISNAAKITSMAGLESDQVPEILRSLDALTNYGHERKFENVTFRTDTPYDMSAVNCDTNLVDLTERLKNAKPNFSLCIYGPPGTGKSEYGRHLASALNKRVLFKRASDLQSMFVGGTEKNIAKAFKEAADEEKVLIIDEGDSFLQNRESARQSWEVSQVNEMLSQMEMHSQPFIITTNLMDNLDPASLRRFVFKLKFDFLKPDAAARMFGAYFGIEAPLPIMRNEMLAPGDFAAVKKRVDVLDIKDAHEIYQMLLEECQLKPQFKYNKPLGFTA